MTIVRYATAATALLAVGVAIGIALVPSPTIQHRRAEADVVRCTEALEITLTLGNYAVHQLRDHIESEFGPLPAIEDLTRDVRTHESRRGL